MKYWRSSVVLAALATAAAYVCPRALPAQVIAGHVTDDRTLRPAIDYVVRLTQRSDTGLVVLNQTTTDPTGHFTLVAPGAGSYVLSFGRSMPRVHRVAVDVEAGASPAPREFPLPIQRDSDTRPYFDVDVDSIRLLPPTASGPTYPGERRQAGASGSTFAMFVVDTIGEVERNSVRLFAGTHADFPRAVEQWLTGGKFHVSHIGRVPVRRQVCLPIVFRLERDAREAARVDRPTVPAVGLATASRALCTRAVDRDGILTVSAPRP